MSEHTALQEDRAFNRGTEMRCLHFGRKIMIAKEDTINFAPGDDIIVHGKGTFCVDRIYMGQYCSELDVHEIAPRSWVS